MFLKDRSSFISLRNLDLYIYICFLCVYIVVHLKSPHVSRPLLYSRYLVRCALIKASWTYWDWARVGPDFEPELFPTLGQSLLMLDRGWTRAFAGVGPEFGDVEPELLPMLGQSLLMLDRGWARVCSCWTRLSQELANIEMRLSQSCQFSHIPWCQKVVSRCGAQFSI